MSPIRDYNVIHALMSLSPDDSPDNSPDDSSGVILT